jgi:hypothetical protein
MNYILTVIVIHLISDTVVKWVAVLLCIHEVPASNLCLKIDYDLKILMVLFSPLRKRARIVSRTSYSHFLPHPLPFIIQ